MNDQPSTAANSTDPAERFEAQLLVVARALPYPPTPNLAAQPRLAAVLARPLRPAPARSLGWALAAALMALAGLLAVPAVRAGVVEVLRLGAVRIILGPAATATLTPAATATGTRPPATATPRPTPTALASVLDLHGQTTLAEARAAVDLPIRLPSYPPDLGQPEAVFVQDLEGEAVVLVWLAPDDPTRVQLSLHILASSTLTEKMLKNRPVSLEFTTVNGREAVWTTGPYFVVARNGFFTETRLVTGHVLIWFEDNLTYRLETDQPLEEAVRMAESLE